MKCSFCQKEIKKDDMFLHIAAYGDATVSPQTQYRCGWWYFHAQCFADLMEKADFVPNPPFPNPKKESSSLFNTFKEIGENIAISIDTEIINEIIKDTEKELLEVIRIYGLVCNIIMEQIDAELNMREFKLEETLSVSWSFDVNEKMYQKIKKKLVSDFKYRNFIIVEANEKIIIKYIGQ